jgi:hypothetical protein
MTTGGMSAPLRRGRIVDEWAIGVASIPISDWLAEAMRLREVPDTALRWFEWPGLGNFVADPIPFTAGGEAFVAYELFNAWKARGAIGVGALRGGTIVHLGIALDDPSLHLAYPFVVERKGELYCIPDSSRADGLSAYVLDTPTRWQHKGLLPGLPKLSDPTLYQADGMWWLLGTSRAYDDERLQVYFSDDLFSEWQQCGGPIPSQAARRPAGPLVDVGGTLIRPSQHSEVRYGAAVNLNEVVAIGPTGYEERFLIRLLPRQDWPYSAGMHTVSGVGEWTMVDASRRTTTARATLQKIHARWERRKRARRGGIRVESSGLPPR